MIVMGCASSCEMEATISPIMLTRLVCASSACPLLQEAESAIGVREHSEV